MTAGEIGALVLLSGFAWSQAVPGEIPDDDVLLAAIARMRAEEWQAARPRLLLVFRPRPGGLLYSQAVGNLHASSAQALARRRERTAAATEARLARSPRDEHVTSTLRQRNETVTSDRPAAAPPRPRPERPESAPSALRAPKESDESRRPGLGAQRGALIRSAPGGRPESAEAPNPLLEQLRAAERRIVFERLKAVRFPWADERHRQFPHKPIELLADNPNATVRQVEWAIAWADRLQFEPDSQLKGYNPLGRVIRAIEKPIAPDLWFTKQYDAREDRRDLEIERLRKRVLAQPAASAGPFKIAGDSA